MARRNATREDRSVNLTQDAYEIVKLVATETGLGVGASASIIVMGFDPAQVSVALVTRMKEAMNAVADKTQRKEPASTLD